MTFWHHLNHTWTTVQLTVYSFVANLLLKISTIINNFRLKIAYMRLRKCDANIYIQALYFTTKPEMRSIKDFNFYNISSYLMYIKRFKP